MKYQDFFDPEDVTTFKRVKLGQMHLARVAREEAARIVGGEIKTSGKEFVYTELGAFRLCVSRNSDNTTEVRAHRAMGATTVMMGSDDRMIDFFLWHGAGFGSLAHWKMRIRARMNDAA